MKADRRAFILGGAALGVGAGASALGLAGVADPLPEGTLAGADLARGHRLVKGDFPAPSAERSTDIAIIGGGVSGLATGWRLAEAGFADFTLLELEDRAGGNARAGQSATTAFPLGAHYLPVPNREARGLRHMLTRFGIIQGMQGDAPLYDPEQLCADLEERLFWQGRWQEGLIPRTGIADAERAELVAFEQAMARFSGMTGADGRPAFASPIAYSSRDPALLALDAVSFAGWLEAQGWRGRVLRGHVRYAMRDDYGCEPEHVSAWAGIHYFAGRRGWAANGAGANELTWPEGNARLARLMAASFAPHILPGQIVHRVACTGAGVAIDHFDVRAGQTIRTLARAAILAVPRFVAARLTPEISAAGHSYAPWLVANVEVSRMPEGRGVPLAWDNVSWTSESLGYVVATHQGPAARTAGTVLTWYLPLSDRPPAEARRLLRDRPAAAWKRMVRDDILATNPELAGAIRRIDLWRWGHAMIRPVPGFIWGARPAPPPPLYLAHSDSAGLPLFEEAHHAGMAAAEAAMAQLGHGFESLL